MDPHLTLAAVGAPIAVLAVILGAVVAIPVGVLAVIYLFVPFFKGIGWLIKQVFVFVFSTISDLLRLVGAMITSLVLVPLTVGSVIIGRWSASAHYGRAIQAEFKNAGRCAYRLAIGNPARLLCLTPLTEGIERRIPEVMAAAPGADRPPRRQGRFPGYEIVGSLPGGGSGGRLYVAKPDEQKLAAFARNGHRDVDRVVIKCFSQHDGTTLPQIVRENRALDAARKLGLILEHDLSNERFYYVMRYVPGESLNLVTQRLHAASGGNGLGRNEMRDALSYAADLLNTLCAYHAGGLWHKDVKPDNVIVCNDRAHLVDFGLVTPLRSSMTLTTHGTEYFRDPEMVRMALKGVKVADVDGARFDIYAVGAVLFSMIENSFPAHGGLSQITRPCPEAVRWIVRRAMTDYDKRYDSAAAMLSDVRAVLAAPDPYALRPANLPSVAAHLDADDMHAAAGSATPPPIPQPAAAAAGPSIPPAGGGAWSYPGMNPGAGVGAGVGAGNGAGASTGARRDASGRLRPDIRVTSWFSGKYAVNGLPMSGVRADVAASAFAAVNAAAAAAAQAIGAASVASAVAARSPRVPRDARASAAAQRHNARERAAAVRQRVRERLGRKSRNFPAGMNAGVAVAVLVFFAFVGVAMITMMRFGAMPRVAIDMPSGSHSRVDGAPALPVVVDPVNVKLPGGAAVSSGRSLPEPPTPPVAPVALTADSRVLIVCEWSKLDAKRRDQVESQIDALNEAGFELVGDASPAEADSSTVDVHNAELIAGLRAAVGTRLFPTPDAGAAVRDWLDSKGEADLVVWFAGIDPGKPDAAITAWLVGASDTAPNVLKAAKASLTSPR